MPLLFYFPLIIWMGMLEIDAGRIARSREGQAATPARRHDLR